MTMKKHPSAFKLCGELAEKVKTVTDSPVTLYEGTYDSVLSRIFVFGGEAGRKASYISITLSILLAESFGGKAWRVGGREASTLPPPLDRTLYDSVSLTIQYTV